jgi:hypothetical protein
MNTQTMIDIQVDLTLPVLSSNFDVIKNQLTEKLQKYNIDVTEETFLESEILIKDINKIIKSIDTKRKDIMNELKAPAEVFNQSCKELVSLCEEAKSNLILQGQEFQTKRLNGWKLILNDYLLSQYVSFTIQDDFKTLNVDDLAMKSNFTDKNNLTSSVKNIIDSRMQSVLSLQNKVAMRLVELENKCLKAGLKSMLERRHIENFIKTDDETYNKNLNNLFENELRRQKEIEDKIVLEQQKEQARILAEQEKRHQAEIDTIKQQQEIIPQIGISLEHKQEAFPNIVNDITVVQEGKKAIRVVATFEFFVDTKNTITDKEVKDKFNNKMRQELVSFNSLKSLEVMVNDGNLI